MVGALETSLLKWLPKAQLPTLGELLIKDTIKEGQFFTHFGAVWCKGATKAISQYEGGKAVSPVPTLRIPFDDAFRVGSVSMPIHPENFTSVSAGCHLQGLKRLFVIARFTDVQSSICEAQAYAIGFMHREPRAPDLFGDVLEAYSNHMEVHVSRIDVFKAIDYSRSPTKRELARLEHIAETDIKTAFAAIIGEAFIPKDWGGETSDLTTSHLAVDGKRLVAAFAFKGPAKFHPMTVADLGKNGDQIYRLFSEPADIVLLQHCHAITQPVRAHMRAFATSTHRPRPFCLIDGADTVRILKAHSLLGFKLTPLK